MPPSQKLWRTFLHVERITSSKPEAQVYCVVPAWNAAEIISFPFALIPQEMQEEALSVRYLLARVNIGAERAEDLRFEDFEIAPPPLEEEEFS